ncbi:MAG: hypothetical protein JOZ74_12965, partial [Bradyrhizobium sp.]|nr:hypothetical protein [Bradyrhizobium sp.]
TTADNRDGGIELDDTVQLTGGATIQGSSGAALGAIANLGTLEVLASASATLTDISLTNAANADTLRLDTNSTLTLNASTITGGQLDNSGLVKIETDGTTSTFDGVDVSNDGASAGIQIDAGLTPPPQPTTLMLDDGTNVTGGTITVGSSGILEVSTAQGATLSGVSVDNFDLVKVDAGSTLTLEATTISGGAINDDSVGGIDVAGTSKIDGAATLSDGGVTIESGVTLTLDNVTVDGTSFEDTATGATIQIDDDVTLTLNGASIDGGTLDIQGELASTGSSSISGATIINSGEIDVVSGTLTIDALSIVTSTAGGTVEADGGNLVVNGTLSGSVEIAAASIVELGDNAPGAYSSATITFETGATGTLKIDGAANFSGTVAGFGSGATIDPTEVAHSPNQYDVWSAGTLSIYSNGTLEARLKLSGAYSQNDFALTSDASGGTDIVWSRAQEATVSGLDHAGNPVEGYAVAANLNDSNASNISYTWLENGQVVPGAAGESYSPTSPSEVGQSLDVVIGFTDNGVSEQITELAGRVVAAPSVSFNTTGPVATAENTPLTLDGLSASFPDAGTDTLTATLSVRDGTLTIDGIASDVASITLTGPLAEINADLANGVTYTPNAAFGGNDSLSFSVSDATSGTIFAASGTQTIAVEPPLTLTGQTITDSLMSTSLNAALWTVVLPPISAEQPYNTSVVPTVDGLELINRGTLETAYGFTPTAAAPLKITFSFRLSDPNDTLFVTDQTNGATDAEYGAASNGISFEVNWPNGGNVRIVDPADPDEGSSVIPAGLSAGTLYVGIITDNGSQQTFTITDSCGDLLAFATSNIALADPLGNLVTFASREDNDGGGGGSHTTLITDVSISEPYAVDEHAVVQLGIADTDTTGGTVTITGLPDDLAAFSGGSYTADAGSNAGSWTGTAAQFNALSFTTGAAGTFELTVSATNAAGETTTQGYALNVNADHWVGAGTADWSTAAEWSYGAAPGNNIDAVIDAAGAYIVTISDSDSAVANSLTITSAGAGADIQDAGSLVLGGALTIDAGSFSLIGGSLSASSIDVESAGYFIAEGSVSVPLADNGGVVQAYGNLSLLDAVTGAGTFEVNGHALAFGSSVAGGTVDFGTVPGALVVAQPLHFGATIHDFAAGDTIDLAGIGAADGYSFDGTTLTLTKDGATIDTLVFSAGLSGPTPFDVGSDGSGGTSIALHQGWTVETDQLTVNQAGANTVINGLLIDDADSAAASFTVTATTGDSDESTVTLSSGSNSASGSLAQVDSALSSMTYDPGSNPPSSDKVTLTVSDNLGFSATENFIFNVNGSGPVSLSGASGNNVIFATGNSDTLTGGGGQDQFVFKPSSAGQTSTVEHTITDFNVNLDTIDLRQFQDLHSIADLQATAANSTDTLLTLDGHEQVLLKSVLPGSLHTSDFIFIH